VHVVGLTGGIGSGKSAFAAELATLGLPVIDADVLARRCVEPGTPALARIGERFGSGVLASDGSLDRAALAAIVFSDARALRDLEAITHPCIRSAIDSELEALRGLEEPPVLAVVEHPLLVETGLHVTVDTVVVVEAPLPARIERLVAQRGMAVADAEARIAAQADDASRRAVADVVVVNDGDRAALRAEAERLVARLHGAEGADR
jgi:dephospho-CoA kinase